MGAGSVTEAGEPPDGTVQPELADQLWDVAAGTQAVLKLMLCPAIGAELLAVVVHVMVELAGGKAVERGGGVMQSSGSGVVTVGWE